MNTPSYIIQQGNQVTFNMRALYGRLGFKDRNYADWFKDRQSQLGLQPEKDFSTRPDGSKINHLVPLPVAKSILGVVFKKRAAPLLMEIDAFLSAPAPGEVNQDQNRPADSPKAEISANTEPEPDKGVKFLFDGPVVVMLIEGRAAIKASDLMNLWNPGRYVKGWMEYRIEKLDLLLGKHYAEFEVRAKRGMTPDYILSLDAAVSIADSEKKGQGRDVVKYLLGIKKNLTAQKLPAKAKLSDFIGAEPVNKPVSGPQGTEPITDTTEGQKLAQTGLFDQSIQTIGEGASQTPAESQEPEGGADTVESPAEVVSPESVENPNPEQGEVFTQSVENPEPQAGDATTGSQEPAPTVDPNAPTVFDLMVQMAQNNLQQAQALAKLYRDLALTQGTVSEMVLIEQAAARHKLGLYPGTAVLPNVTLRDKINYAVRKRADATGEKHEDIFKAVYARLANDYGYSVLDMPRKKGQSHLNVCEELGLISIVWDIVNSRAFNQYGPQRQAA
ncbi:hypothetical protein GCM10027299_28880 [Larkinella ripae]